MNTITVTYRLKWQFKTMPHIKISEDKRIFNTRTGRELKITVNGYSVGFWLGRKFILMSKLNDYIELIPNIKIPY